MNWRMPSRDRPARAHVDGVPLRGVTLGDTSDEREEAYAGVGRRSPTPSPSSSR